MCFCRLGLDAHMLAKILNMSSGRCWSSEVYNPCPGVVPGVPSSNNYQGGFGTALMTKVSFWRPLSQRITKQCCWHLGVLAARMCDNFLQNVLTNK